MFGLMLALGIIGALLLLGGSTVARLVVGRDGDPVGLTRIFQVAGILLLLIALLLRPHSDETSAFPPPPDARPAGSSR